MFRRIDVPEDLCQTLGTFDEVPVHTHPITQDVMFHLVKVWSWLVYYRLNVTLCPVTYKYNIYFFDFFLSACSKLSSSWSVYICLVASIC